MGVLNHKFLLELAHPIEARKPILLFGRASLILPQ